MRVVAEIGRKMPMPRPAGARPAVLPAGRSCEPLRGLVESSVADRFQTWTGHSGRRYIFSVYPLTPDRDGTDDAPVGVAVAIGIERGADGHRIPVFITDVSHLPEVFLASEAVRRLRRLPHAELHLHLTAATGGERRRIVADLALC